MIKNILLLIVLFVNLQEAVSQNTFFIGDKVYPCSDSYLFGKKDYLNGSREVKINFLKDGERGIVAITINNYLLPNTRVKNKLILYLDNNQVITCIDRRKFDIVNDYATTLYYLTKDEINKLKNSNIATIRYTVGDDYGLNMNRSVTNTDVESYFGVIERIDFPSELSAFFE